LKLFNFSHKLLKKFKRHFLKKPIFFGKTSLYNYEIFIEKKFSKKMFFFNYSFNNNVFKKSLISYKNKAKLDI